jgi:hypothetical protein
LTKLIVKLGIVTATALLFVAFMSSLAFAQGEAAGAIASAKQQLIVSYHSAKTAEAAGANTSSLTAVLNDAGDLLSRSELAYSQGNFADAQSLASQCAQTLSGLASTADVLRGEAEQRRSYDFWVNIVGSAVGTLIVLVTGVGVWLVVKRRHVPVEFEVEVQTDDSSRE